MTHVYPEGFPPIPNLLQATSTAKPGTATPSTDKLRSLAWALYSSGTFFETIKGGLNKAGLSATVITAIDASIDGYVDLINAAIPFLSTYVDAVKTGKWPAVEIPMPPVIDPKATIAQQVINDIEGAVNTAIIAFQKSPNGEEVANGLQALQKGLNDLVDTIQQYYPNLLK